MVGELSTGLMAVPGLCIEFMVLVVEDIESGCKSEKWKVNKLGPKL